MLSVRINDDNDLYRRVRRVETTNNFIVIFLILLSVKIFSLTGQTLCSTSPFNSGFPNEEPLDIVEKTITKNTKGQTSDDLSIVELKVFQPTALQNKQSTGSSREDLVQNMPEKPLSESMTTKELDASLLSFALPEPKKYKNMDRERKKNANFSLLSNVNENVKKSNSNEHSTTYSHIPNGKSQGSIHQMSFHEAKKKITYSIRNNFMKVRENRNQIIESNHKVSEPINSRKLQTGGTDMTCDGTFLHLELDLDGRANETSWEIRDAATDTVAASQNFTSLDDSTKKFFSMCLVPGPYTFTLKDSSGDGIQCDNLKCYNLSLNNQLMVNNNDTFVGREIVHTFDSSSPCILDNIFLIHFKRISAGTTWSVHDIRSGEEMIFEEILNGSNDDETYFRCISPGSYSFQAFPPPGESLLCDSDDCINFTVNGSPLWMNKKSSKSSAFNIFFYITRDGHGREQLCLSSPILSPVGSFSQGIYNDDVSRKLDVIYSLSSFEDVHNASTPQYKAACKMIYDDAHHLNVSDQQWSSRYAFSTLLYALNINADEIPKDICDYDVNRIECDDIGFITKINIGGLNLKGFIPDEIRNFHRLKILLANDNNLEGTIPSTLGHLFFLEHLNIESNNFRGTIFTEIGSMESLNFLYLGQNKLSGTIPSEIGSCTKMLRLGLNFNNLVGSIPSHLYGLTQMFGLGLYNNNLSGTISANIKELKALNFVRMENNAFSGTMPSEIGELDITWLSLNNNKLTGAIPKEIGNCENLSRFTVSRNLLTGTISDLFDLCPDLEFLELSSNTFTGTIPTTLLKFENLLDLTLNYNDFTGAVLIDDCKKYQNLLMDTAKWFLDGPKVDCTCCDIQDCHVWDVLKEETKIPCPESNLYKLEYFNKYKVRDLHAKSETSLSEFNTFGHAELCLSPTGCYTISNGELVDDALIEKKFDLTFSSNTSALVFNNACEDVSICDEVFDSIDPRRKVLNHLTQIVDLDFLNKNDPTYLTMCWLLTSDEFHQNYDVCDGTILQRFVLAKFYLSAEYVNAEFVDAEESISDLSSTHTCSWPGVRCDANDRFVEEFNMSKKNLTGTIITELGLLTRLKVIDLGHNHLHGTLDPKIFAHLPHLRFLKIDDNSLEGNIPEEVFSLPQIIQVNMSDNILGGNLPSNITYSESIEYINVGKNILGGSLPKVLCNARWLQFLDVSENSLSGYIPSDIGNLRSLQEVKLNQNRFSGTIPNKIFDARSIESFSIHNNQLTGTVPTEIGHLLNAVKIRMNHNALKSSIPFELEQLPKLRMLHLHQNKFSGKAPKRSKTASEVDEKAYIADCNSVRNLTCTDCTLCCDDDGNCKPYTLDAVPLYQKSLGIIVAIPLLCSAFYIALYSVQRKTSSRLLRLQQRDPLSIYNKESVYSYIFSRSALAWGVHLVILGIQFALFFMFLWASDPSNSNSILSPSLKCLPDNNDCLSTRQSIQWFGWALFFLLTLLYIGTDVVNALLQIKQSLASPFDPRLLTNGVALMFLTLASIIASFSYNQAVAGSNTDLIVNAVTLLFINGLDEQTMTLLAKAFPNWQEDRVKEIKNYLLQRQRSINMTRSQIDSQMNGEQVLENLECPPDSSVHSSSFKSAHSDIDSIKQSASFPEAGFEISKPPSWFQAVSFHSGVEIQLK